MINWLSYGSLDFDFIAESLLPDLCPAGGAPLKVGQMAYDAVVVPGCETLRSSTCERLEAFCAAGGRLIVMGDAPRWENALPSGRGEALAASAQHIPFMRKALLEALEPVGRPAHPVRQAEISRTVCSPAAAGRGGTLAVYCGGRHYPE